jgi:hypothetical protein
MTPRGQFSMARDKHQPGRIEQALFAHPASTCPRHVCTLLLCRAQAFF